LDFPCGKNKNKPPVWEWFVPPIYGEIGDSLLLFYQHYILTIFQRLFSCSATGQLSPTSRLCASDGYEAVSDVLTNSFIVVHPNHTETLSKNMFSSILTDFAIAFAAATHVATFARLSLSFRELHDCGTSQDSGGRQEVLSSSFDDQKISHV